ncbi:hypothetical protein P154DRAFT_559675 [Amniculicola lignicola CBS 123094]|uniref:F-box domain-containing protein n=1 Tax=Amniculicola lignicola CBS 123094 TaxID=1392246 RepID=A0A6A5WYG2_9PLEO|nr:hypothetical protein P154DRAFT_559675 [Amniculicola lignicola CBS 123094]
MSIAQVCPHLPQEIWSHILGFLLSDADDDTERWLWSHSRRACKTFKGEVEYLFCARHLPRIKIFFQLYDTSTSQHNYDKTPIIEYKSCRSQSNGRAYLTLVDMPYPCVPFVAHFLGGLRQSNPVSWTTEGEPWYFTFFKRWIKMQRQSNERMHDSGGTENWHNLSAGSSPHDTEIPKLQVKDDFRELSFDWHELYNRLYAESNNNSNKPTCPSRGDMGFFQYDLPLHLTRKELESWKLNIWVDCAGRWQIAHSLSLN